MIADSTVPWQFHRCDKTALVFKTKHPATGGVLVCFAPHFVRKRSALPAFLCGNNDGANANHAIHEV